MMIFRYKIYKTSEEWHSLSLSMDELKNILYDYLDDKDILIELVGEDGRKYSIIDIEMFLEKIGRAFEGGNVVSLHNTPYIQIRFPVA